MSSNREYQKRIRNVSCASETGVAVRLRGLFPLQLLYDLHHRFYFYYFYDFNVCVQILLPLENKMAALFAQQRTLLIAEEGTVNKLQ